MADRHRAAAERATSAAAFAEAITPMLAELRDLHVWIELPDGRGLATHRSQVAGNDNLPAMVERLDLVKRIEGVGFVGTTDRFGVLVVEALPGDGDARYEQLIEATVRLFDAPAFVVDLRANVGGSEVRAAQLAGLFAEKEYVYARSRVRQGPSLDAMRESPPRRIAPGVPEPFTGPVACLIGPRCVSSGEGFAMMMKAIDHVTLLGQPTRGASGNPRPMHLSNGVKVWFSRWVDLLPDETPIEGRGVEPDLCVEHEGEGDPTFDRAIRFLQSQTGQAGRGVETPE